ncbi:phosphonate C-P lyase system protein PhnH [Pontibacillus salicampi]|uniref:Phosphonate C-P lyase system protein PhnH n=1 Tax=Pontibacillus salicampi TaxID=1449801 RepID=A0ABV6LRT3_9BACI
MTKMTKAGFDSVHDTQHIFRELVEATSRPGTIAELTSYVEGLSPSVTFSKPMIGLALTLLDQEVTFHVQAENVKRIQEYIHWHTFSQAMEESEADYVFVSILESSRIASFMKHLKRGTLYQPHQSATLFIQVKDFKDGADADKFILSGPGIKDSTSIVVNGLDEEWIDARNEAVQEYPLGIDVCLVSEQGELVALPRTTKIERG